MPRNGSGTYTLPQAPFVPNTTMSSSAVNSDLSDIALALTGSVAADGQTPITGAFKLADGSASLPAYTFVTDTNDGIFHYASGIVGIATDGITRMYVQAPSQFCGGGFVGTSGVNCIPIGLIQDFAGATIPDGWLQCYGQAVSRTTYSILFIVIGTTYGSGNGTTTFNLPDLRGRVTAGADNMGGSAAGRLTGYSLSITGGSQTHTLTTTELPSHQHSGTTGGMSANNPHTHSVAQATTFANAQSGAGVNNAWSGATVTITGSTDIAHTHTFTTDGGSVGDGSHNNIQPTAALNKIIFAGQQ